MRKAPPGDVTNQRYLVTVARTRLVEAGSELPGERGERRSSLPEEAGVQATEQRDKCPQTARPTGNPPCPSIHTGLHTGLEQPLSRLPAARTVNSRSCPALLESGCWDQESPAAGGLLIPQRAFEPAGVRHPSSQRRAECLTTAVPCGPSSCPLSPST